MADFQISNSKKNTTGVKRLSKKSTKVDLTPMVDLGFLLITFFVFTTTMSMTTAMENIEPKDGVSMPVPSSGATTFLVGKGNKIIYYFGDFETAKANNEIKETNIIDLRNIITQKKKNTKLSKLMFIIKASDKCTFGNVISITDELNICGIKAGHYAEVVMSEEERMLIE